MQKSNFTDLLIVCTGTSSTHIKSISDSVIENLKNNGYSKIIRGIEPNNDWILIKLHDDHYKGWVLNYTNYNYEDAHVSQKIDVSDFKKLDQGIKKSLKETISLFYEKKYI